MSALRRTNVKRYFTAAAAARLAISALAESVLIRLGQTYGSVLAERAIHLLGDDIVPDPQVVTNHAIDIDASRLRVALAGADGMASRRLVHRPLGRSATAPGELAQCEPDHSRAAGHPRRRLHPGRRTGTKCGLIVERLEPGRAMALHSTSHLPMSWRAKVSLD